MAGNSVNGGGYGARSGAQTLVLLATPLNVVVLQALAEGPRQQADLARACGSPPPTTLRARLRNLAELGVLERRRRNRFPGVLEYELTPTGGELLSIVGVMQDWLRNAPTGPLELGTSAAKAAVGALAEGWSTAMLRAIASQPLSLTDLDRVIGALSYPSLERRLSALRSAGLIEVHAGNKRGTAYTATVWLRQAVAPLIAAIRWEQTHCPQSPPFGRLDFEAALLLAVPLLDLPSEVSGSCSTAAELGNENSQLAGAVVKVEHGAVVRYSTKLGGAPDAWALGSTGAWLAALLDHDLDRLELGGDGGLARRLIDGLHESLSQSGLSPVRKRLDAPETV